MSDQPGIEGHKPKMSLLAKGLDHYLPRRAKRMIFLSALYGYICDTDTVSDELVTKLNELLHLTNDPNALKFPLLINNSIWKKLDQPVSFNDGLQAPSFHVLLKRDVFFRRIDEIIEVMVLRAPQWLLYGPKHVVAKDVRLMIERLV